MVVAHAHRSWHSTVHPAHAARSQACVALLHTLCCAAAALSWRSSCGAGCVLPSSPSKHGPARAWSAPTHKALRPSLSLLPTAASRSLASASSGGSSSAGSSKGQPQKGGGSRGVPSRSSSSSSFSSSGGRVGSISSLSSSSGRACGGAGEGEGEGRGGHAAAPARGALLTLEPAASGVLAGGCSSCPGGQGGGLGGRDVGGRRRGERRGGGGGGGFAMGEGWG